MLLFYRIFIKLYAFSIELAKPFSFKARQWVNERNLQKNIIFPFENSKVAWFHCASTGEFEQGLPLMQHVKKQYPTYKIVLTFFSPSGYHAKKNVAEADVVLYLPADTPKNAYSFIKAINPDIAFFIKYEFWYNYILELQKNNIPLFFISSIFRKEQYFFKFWGEPFMKILRNVNCFFIQDKNSEILLKNYGFKNIVTVGDTRFDRVLDAVAIRKPLPEIKSFCSDKKVLVAGSTWCADEKLLIAYLNSKYYDKNNCKTIIVPHEINKNHIQKLILSLNLKAIRYSDYLNSNIESDVLIIDSVGLLLSIYQYAYFAYIGGGFGKGIHNILEASAYGIPVVFGKKYHKFNEAKQLVNRGGAFSIRNEVELFSIFDKLFNNTNYYSYTADIAKEYVNENIGATQKIFDYLENLEVFNKY